MNLRYDGCIGSTLIGMLYAAVTGPPGRAQFRVPTRGERAMMRVHETTHPKRVAGSGRIACRMSGYIGEEVVRRSPCKAI